MVVAEPERADGTADRWPAWYAPAGFLIGLGVTLLLGGIIAAFAIALGGSPDGSPLRTALATLAQAVAFVGTAVFLAGRVGTPIPADFGLRTIPIRRAVGATALAVVAFYLLSAVYAAIVRPSGEQDVLEALGADEGTAYLALTAVVVLVVAPVAEEIFFRGFVYRALRNRFSTPVSAGIVGVVFGSIHYSGPDTLTLLPVLALLGVTFCLLYEWSGSLYPAIALHGINNTAAYLVSADGEAALPIGLVLGGATVLAALVGLGTRSRRVM